MKRSLANLLPLVAGGIILAALLHTPAPAQPEADPPPSPRVRVAEVSDAPSTRAHVFHSITRAGDRAALSFPVGGRLLERRVSVGDVVEAGQVIAAVDPAPYRHQVDGARAQIDEIDTRLAQLEREEARARRLIDAEIGSAQALEQVETEREALEAARRAASARLSEARRQRDEATLEAPLSGVVAETFVEPGEVVAPGTPVVMLVGEAAIEVEFDVPEGVFASLHEGQAVEVRFPLSGDRTVPARISVVGRSAATRGRLFPVVARVEAGDADIAVAPGMAAEVRVEVDEAAALAVPVGAVIDPRRGQPAVFRVEDGRVALVPVRVLGLRGDVVLVAAESGHALHAGESLVVAGHAQLVDGDAVEVAR